MFFKWLINTVMVILKLANKTKQNPDSRSEIRTFLETLLVELHQSTVYVIQYYG